MNDEHDDAPDEKRVLNVRVTNKNDFSISDRFDGVEFIFPPDNGRRKGTTLPIDAAFHIFGWHPGADREVVNRYVQKRMGWNTPDLVKTGAAKRFADNLEIVAIEYRMVPVELDDNGRKRVMEKPNKLMEAANEAEARRRANDMAGAGA